MASQIPMIGVPQPTFPQLAMEIKVNEGLFIQIVLAPGFTFTQGINAESVNGIVLQWLKANPQFAIQVMQQLKQEMLVIQDVQKSKNV